MKNKQIDIMDSKIKYKCNAFFNMPKKATVTAFLNELLLCRNLMKKLGILNTDPRGFIKIDSPLRRRLAVFRFYQEANLVQWKNPNDLCYPVVFPNYLIFEIHFKKIHFGLGY